MTTPQTHIFDVYQRDGVFVGYAWALDATDAIQRVTGYTGDDATSYVAESRDCCGEEQS